MDSSPALVFETYDDPSAIKKEHELDWEIKERLREVSCLFILDATPTQMYMANLLGQRGHYQLHQSKCRELQLLVAEQQDWRKKNGRPETLVRWIKRNETVEDPTRGLSAWKDLDILQLFGGYNGFPEIVERLSRKGLSPERNHHRIDIGCCGNNNLGRDSWLGLPKPRCFEATMTNFGMELNEAFATAVHNSGKIVKGTFYNDEERNIEFSRQYVRDGASNAFESIACILQRTHASGQVPVEDQLLKLHRDTHNDDKPEAGCDYSVVISLAVWMLDTESGCVYRWVLISYGKDAARDYMARKKKFQAPILAVKQVWENLPPKQKEISPDLLTKDPNGLFLDHPHCQKTVYYSAAVGPIIEAKEVFEREGIIEPNNPDYAIALVLCSEIHNCPQMFTHELRHLIKNPGLLKQASLPWSPEDFLCHFMEKLHRIKDNPSLQCWPYEMRSRLMPSTNSGFSRVQAINSLISAKKFVAEIQKLLLTNPRELHFQWKFYCHFGVGWFAQPCPSTPVCLDDPNLNCGIHGNGPLLSQHSFQKMAGVGVLPRQFMCHAEFAQSTKTWTWFQGRYPGSFENELDGNEYLEALSVALGVCKTTAEEVNCRAKQELSGTSGRHSDWVPPDGLLMILGSVANRDEVLCMDHNGLVVELPQPAYNFGPLIAAGTNAEDSFFNKKVIRLIPPKRSANGVRPIRTRNLFSVLTSTDLFFKGMHDVAFPRQGLPKGTGVELPNPETVIRSPREAHSIVFMTDLDDFVPEGNYRWQTLKVSANGAVTIHLGRKTERAAANARKHFPDGKGNKRLSKRQRGKIIGKSKVPRTEDPTEARVVTVGSSTDFPGLKSGQKFYAYSIDVASRGGVEDKRTEVLHHPKADFVLREDYHNSVGGSVVVDGRRYFSCRKSAKRFAILHLMLTEPHSIKKERLLRTLLTPPVLNQSNRDCIDHPNIVAMKVICTSREDKSRTPAMVIVSYKRGGTGVYLCDDCGNPTTPVHLQIPPSVGNRKIGNKTMLSAYTSVLGCRRVPLQNSRKHTKEVLIRWTDHHTSWESLSTLMKEGTHFHLFLFAKKHGLMNEVGWSIVKKWEKHQLDKDHLKGQVYFETLQRSSDQLKLWEAEKEKQLRMEVIKDATSLLFPDVELLKDDDFPDCAS